MIWWRQQSTPDLRHDPTKAYCPPIWIEMAKRAKHIDLARLTHYLD